MQAGFNAGDGRGFTALPYSHSIKMKDIDENGGSDIPGRFYYLISPDRPVRGGCTTDTSLSKSPTNNIIFTLTRVTALKYVCISHVNQRGFFSLKSS